MLEITGIVLILGGGALSRWALSKGERQVNLCGLGLCVVGLLIVIIDAWR
jgi:hypothetical protein